MLRTILVGALATALGGGAASAQDTIKIGMVLPLTGGQASVGKQIQAAAKLYMEKNGSTVAGKKLDLSSEMTPLLQTTPNVLPRSSSLMTRSASLFRRSPRARARSGHCRPRARPPTWWWSPAPRA
jgi:hypothetical protein